MESSKRFAAYIWLLLLVWGDHHSTNGPLIESHKIICLFCPLFLFLQWYKLRVKEAESCRSAKKNRPSLQSTHFFCKTHRVGCGCSQVYGNSWDFPERRCLSWGNCDEKKSKFSNNVELPKVRYATCQGRLVRWGCCQSYNDLTTDRPLTRLLNGILPGWCWQTLRQVLKRLSMNTLLLAFFYVQVLIFDYIRLLNFFGIPKFPYEKQIRNFVFRRQNTNDMIR